MVKLEQIFDRKEQEKMIRFLHAADLHLDSPFKGITDMPADRLAGLRESTFTAFRNLIRHALAVRPDFVLLAGDIYDGEDRSLRAQKRFHDGLEQLGAAGIPVFLSHGNHDHLSGGWVRFGLPDNVTVFGPDVETYELTVREHKVAIHGFSYRERHIERAMITDYPAAAPDDGILHIGMLHGSIAGDKSHAVYAPFTKESLLQKNYAYWALGHIHKRQLLHSNPPIVYPGCLQGRHKTEPGMNGFYDVELGGPEVSMQFVPCSAVVFGEIEVDCSHVRHATDWLNACLAKAGSMTARTGPVILRVHNCRLSEEAEQLFAGAPRAEWLEILRESAGDDVWFSGVDFEPSGTGSGLGDSPLIRSVMERLSGWDAEEWQSVLADVYQHARSAPYLEPADEERQQRVKAAAADLVAGELAK